jgi:hypothetical protein
MRSTPPRTGPGDLGGLGDVEAALVPFAGRDAHEDGNLLTDLGADGRIDLVEHAGTTGEVTAVVVGALVRQRREEGMEQIAVGGVESRRGRTRRRSHGARPRRRRRPPRRCPHVISCRFGQLRVGDRAGAQRRPSAVGFGDAALGLTGEGTVGARLAAGVGELDADDAALGVDEVDDGRPGFGLLVVPDPCVLRGDASLGDDGGRLGEDESESALRSGAEVDEMPRTGHAVLGFAGVLAHRGEPDAVGDLGPAQGERFEQLSHGSSLPVPPVVRQRSRIPEPRADRRSQ